ARVRHAITDTRPASPLVVVGSAYARLLYGASNPTIEPADAVILTRQIVENYIDDASRWLFKLDLPLDAADVAQLPPGEQGSRLGEKACELLGADGESWVNIQSILDAADIEITDINLSDTQLRAVSIFGPTQRPHILLNCNTRWAQSS